MLTIQKIKRKWIAAVMIIAVLLIMTAGLLIWNGIILLNNPSSTQYPVRGVDVSSYQGEIDWETLSKQDISFTYIKATEGSSMVDRCFAENYKNAQKTDLRVGAYHFFSYDSPGLSQAEHFIKTVPPCENMLPPVVDLEFYGDKEKNPPDQLEVRKQLDDCLQKLTEHYGITPVLYATEKSYSLYLKNSYEEYDIWIRNVVTSPSLSDGREWTFWQYTNRKRLDGYTGKEPYIDLNVFNGSEDQFESYGK